MSDYTEGFIPRGRVIPPLKSRAAVEKPEPKTEPKPVVLDEVGQRLRYHVQHSGLLPCDYNVQTIKAWFAQHPDIKADADTVDRVLFVELEHELAFDPKNAKHDWWVAKMNPSPPQPAAKPAEPPKKDWGRLPNGEARLPIPSTEAELHKSSLAQVLDYRNRLRNK